MRVWRGFEEVGGVDAPLHGGEAVARVAWPPVGFGCWHVRQSLRAWRHRRHRGSRALNQAPNRTSMRMSDTSIDVDNVSLQSNEVSPVSRSGSPAQQEPAEPVRECF